MNESCEHGHELKALAMRVAALEDNVAFLEQWCEEQQDALDRAHPHRPPRVASAEAPKERAVLRVVDLRDGFEPADGDDDIFVVDETEHDERVRQIRARIHRLQVRLAASLAPPAAPKPPRPRHRAATSAVSARPTGRTVP